MKTSTLFAALLTLTLAGPALAGQRAAAPAAPRASAPPQAPPVQPMQIMPPMQDDRDARETREWFRKVLEQYPPSVRDVLRLDTSLLSRADYLATYPALAAFLQQHPEVAHNPAYFVGTPDREQESGPQAVSMEMVRTWHDATQFLGVVAIVFIITSALAGVIRTLIDQHRWQRASKMHMEIQNKLLDRFASSGELLAYLETPTGRGLADLQLPGLGSAARPSDTPANRIFWPLQTGIVVTAGGIGLGFMARHFGMTEMSEPVAGVGVLVGAIGLGFIVSAVASFLLSHRLGLMPPRNS